MIIDTQSWLLVESLSEKWKERVGIESKTVLINLDAWYTIVYIVGKADFLCMWSWKNCSLPILIKIVTINAIFLVKWIIKNEGLVALYWSLKNQKFTMVNLYDYILDYQISTTCCNV